MKDIKKNEKFNESASKNHQRQRKSPIKCQEMKGIKQEIKSDIELESVYMNTDDNDYFSPSKLSNNSLFDTSMLDEKEVVKMLHDADNIFELDNIQLLNDSILNISIADENVSNGNPVAKSPVDPLSLDNENLSETNETHNKSNETLNKLRPREVTNYCQKTEDSSLSEDESEKDVDDLKENLFKDWKKNKKKETLSSETIKRLNELEVKFTHVVPPQHEIGSYAGSSPLIKKEWKRFDKISKRIKSKFTKEEDMIIKENWKLFCKIHDWDEKDVYPFLKLKHQGKIYISNFEERKKFVQFLAKGLPYRTLFSVYQRFRFLFNNHKSTGRFTPEEDKKIMIFMKTSKTNERQKIRELSKILSRPYLSTYRRYKTLLDTKKKRKRKSQDKVEWTLELTDCFLKNLMEITLSKNIKQLKNQQIPMVVWKQLEKRLKIGINSLKNFWFGKLHLQLFSPVQIYLNEIKLKLIELLKSSGISNVKEINWKELLNHFDGMTVHFLCDITFRMLKHVKRADKSKTFLEYLNDLCEKMVPRLKEESEDKILPRLCYEKGKLTIVDEIEEIQSDADSFEEDDTLSKRKSAIKSSETTKVVRTENRNFIWTVSLREEFIKMLLETMTFKDIRELKNAVIPAIVWEKLAEKFHVHRNELENLWHNELHMQLYSPSPIYLNDLKIKLIELIYEKKIENEQELNWEKIGSFFDGLTTNFLSQLFHDLVDDAIIEIKSSKFSDVMKFLHETTLPKLKNGQFDKFLPRIIFKNEKIQVKDENLKREECFESEIENESEINWTLPLREHFLKLLLSLNLNTRIEELKDAEIPTVVWEKMENQLKIDKNTLQDLWYKELHLQLFSSKPIYLNDVKMNLIELIYKREINDEKEINWNEICSHFDGMTAIFLLQLFADLVNFASREIESSKFCEIREYLYKTMFPKLKTEKCDRFLPRISFEHDRIKMIDGEEKNFTTCKREENFKPEISNDSEMYRALSVREKFLKLLLRLTVNTKIENLKDAEIPTILWEEMENLLKVDKIVLQDLWYKELHLQLFSSKPIYLNDVKMNLIELIYKREITDEKEINWNEISSHFDGMTPIFLLQLFVDLVNFASRKIESSKFSEIMKFLYETMFPKLKTGKFDRILPLISFENGRINVIDEEDENSEICKKGENSEPEISNDSEMYWTLSMREEFLNLLLQLTVNTKIENLKDAEIPTIIWEEMEKQLKVDKNVLQDLWYTELHLQLFSSEPIYLNDIRINLIELIYKKKIKDKNEINWNEICSHFGGLTTVFLSQLFDDLFNFATKQIKSSNFCDIMEYLHETMFNKLKTVSMDQLLPRIIYDNGKINTVFKESENVLNCKEKST